MISRLSIGLNHSVGWGKNSPKKKKNPFSKSLPLPVVIIVHNVGNTKTETQSFARRNSRQCVENEIYCYGFTQEVAGFASQHQNPVQNPCHSGQPFLRCLTLTVLSLASFLHS